MKVNQNIEKKQKDLTDEEKIRNIYLNLGIKFSYNRDYLYSDWWKSKEIYEKSIMQEVLENADSSNKIEAICKQMATSLAEAINHIPRETTQEKIVAKIVGYRLDEERHIGTLVTIGQKSYYLDLYKDLYKIQRGMKTSYFAPSKEILNEIKQMYPSIQEDVDGIEFDTIDEEQLKQMDIKLGYLKYGLYIDDVIETLKKEMKDEQNLREYIKDYDKIKDKEERSKVILKWKIEYMFRYLKNEFLEDNIGMEEKSKLYRKIYYSLLTNEEIKNSRIYDSDIHYKDKNGKRKQGSIYEIDIYEEKIYYIYDEEQKGFVPISREELQRRREDNSLSFDNYCVR